MHTNRIPMGRRIGLRGVAVLLALGAFTAGAFPATIQYQGYVTDADGGPVTGLLTVVFRLFAEADPGAAPLPVWQETHLEVSILDGHFARVLGEISPFADAGVSFEMPLFLELEIGGEPLLPRIALRAVPYALRAAGVVPGGITSPMLAPHAVTPGKLDVALAGSGLSMGADGILRVATAGITAVMLADGAIADRHIAPDAAITPEKVLGTAVTLGDAQTLENKTLDATRNTITNLDLGAFRPGVVVTDLGAPPKTHETIPTADAVRALFDAADTLAELDDTGIAAPVPGQVLIMHGSGRWENRTLGGDVLLDANGKITVAPDAVQLGVDTNGLYVAALEAGDGLRGGGSGEGALLSFAINVDGLTLDIESNALRVRPGGIGPAQLADAIDASGKGFRAAAALEADQVDGADVDDGAAASPVIIWSSARTSAYAEALLASHSWQQQVARFVRTVPPSPAPGTRVIADGVPGWNEGSIYQFDGAEWREI
ncbi:MAG: hypothetical protein JXR77_13990, partial [Lentisphaeria bacterium]|nr:hypothetical protein [Lentisphaeria bacterium]